MKKPPPSPVAAALQPFVDRRWIAGAVALVADKNRVLGPGYRPLRANGPPRRRGGQPAPPLPHGA